MFAAFVVRQMTRRCKITDVDGKYVATVPKLGET